MELYNFVGGFGVLLVMGHEWKPKDKWTRSMELLAREVIPKINDLLRENNIKLGKGITEI